MNNTEIPAIWWRWMLAVCAFAFVFGMALALVPSLFEEVMIAPYYDFRSDGADYAAVPEAARDFVDFSFGVVGGVMAGWMVALAAVIYGPFRRGERTGWLVVVGSVLAWLLLDCFASIATGYSINLLLNAGFVIAFAPPLIATYRHFFPAQAARTPVTG